MKKVNVVIIGGGPAGLAAAISAKEAGESNILILERDIKLGGILNQCIHNGFGLHTFKEELTGPEYANRFIEKVIEQKIPYKLNTMVMDISSDKVVTAMNAKEGLFQIQAKAIILAMGCRERPRGALNIPGYRPAGIYSAGTAQKLVNIDGLMPGKEVVILGSGDIGLIMARRMTLEGAKVKVVAELMPYSGGLKRNIVQCLDDFGIPLKLSHTVVDIEGKERVEAVTIAEVKDGKPVSGTEERYTCDTLLLSCGLIPENELSNQAGIEMSPITKGPKVNESLETNVDGIFACGNVLHVHDLVDFVSQEAKQAGKNAVKYLKEQEIENTKVIPIETENGVRYSVPFVVRPEDMDDLLTVRFRVGNVFKDSYISVYFNDERVQHRKKQVMAPGEMEQIILKKAEEEAVRREQEARQQAIAAVHAGWRGTAQGIAYKAVLRMQAEFGCAPEHIRAAIGPCIGRCCFEVGPEVPEAMRRSLGPDAEAAIELHGEKAHVDLKRLNRIWLERAGVQVIDICPDCTKCQPERFWSHRVTGGNRGSHAAIIRLKGGAPA